MHPPGFLKDHPRWRRRTNDRSTTATGDEHPVRTLAYLLRADRRQLASAVVVFTVKHSPIWLLPLITASIIDTVVQHQPVSRLWTATGVIMVILVVNYPLHLLYVRLLYGYTALHRGQAA